MNGHPMKFSHLFFADDILFFCQLSISNLLHLRCIVLCFQAASGLKINMKKSELIMLDNNSSDSLAGVLGCKTAQLPIKHLGIPLGAMHKDSSSWEPIIDIFQHWLACWKRKYLSKGGG